MRDISVQLDRAGVPRPMLNGKFLFQVGTLDQGFWPDGIYTAPSDEALAYDVAMHKKLGFNMVRKHVKIEMRRWYYHCDRLGLLVWQDIPSTKIRETNLRDFFDETERIVKSRRFHPSIILWIVYNEGWGEPKDDFAVAGVTAKLRGIDPTRLINSLSGINFNTAGANRDTGVGDVIDLHNYPLPGRIAHQDFRFSVAGEYGGLGLYVKEHSWDYSFCSSYFKAAGSKMLMSMFTDLQRFVLGM